MFEFLTCLTFAAFLHNPDCRRLESSIIFYKIKRDLVDFLLS